MLEPFPKIPGAADAAAVKLRRTGFNVQEVVGGDSVVLHLQGELDMATAAHLRHALDQALTGDASGLVLDLTDLTFVDSTGINLFLSASRQAEDRDRSFALRHPSRMVRKSLRLSGVARQLKVGPTDHPASNHSPGADRRDGAPGAR